MPPSNKGRQIKIHKAQIPSNMSDKAIALINDALDKFQIEKVIILSYIITVHILIFLFKIKDMATFVKKKCDEDFGGTWHCVIGRNFGCSITHDTKFVLFFQVDLMHILLFRSIE